MVSNRHGSAQRRVVWPPEPGFFVITLVRGAWRVPARIVQDENGWHAEVNGETHPSHSDPALAKMVSAIWHGGTRVAESDHSWFVAVREHAAKTDPDHPSLHPRKPIDPRLLKPIHF